MDMRKILLWGLPFLLVGVLITTLILQKQEQKYHAVRQVGWTYHEGNGVAPYGFGKYEGRDGDIAIDEAGRIWAAGGCSGFFGLHVFDGDEWNSRDGYYKDLAVGLNGQVWALKCNTSYRDFDGRDWDEWETFLEIFDGQEWTTYEMSDFGVPYDPQDAPASMKEITQVEVDSRGNLWIVTKYHGEMEVVEIILRQDNDQIQFSLGEQKTFNGTIISLDADDRGRVWVAVKGYGISMYDENGWTQIPDAGLNLQYVVMTVLDKQDRLWVGTACGGIMMYDEKEWVTIVEEETEDDSCEAFDIYGKKYRKIDGITLDNQKRVWAWNNDGVQILNDNAWTYLTPENSGLAGTGFFGVVIDDQDRVWVGRSQWPPRGEVSMANMRDVKPIPKEIVDQHNRLSPIIDYFTVGGMTWFLGSILVILWIATFLNALPGVLLVISLGLLSLFLGPPTIHDHGFPTDYPVTNPGVYATYVGVLGGLIGRYIDTKFKRSKRAKWALLLGTSTWIIIFGSFMCLWLFLPK